MKDLLFPSVFLTLLLLAGSQLFAQVSNQRQMMSRGNNEALILTLPSADDKLVADLWEDWLKDNYRVKTKKTKGARNGETSTLNFGIPGVSTGGKVDLYSTVSEVGSGSELTVWIATPEGYVNPDLDASAYVAAEKMLMRFALTVSREQIDQDVDNQEDVLKDLEKELDRLRKDKERAEKDIVDAHKLIAEKEAEIQQNIVSQENKAREIEAQMQVVEDTKRRLKQY